MIVGFICPDTTKIGAAECISNCRMPKRCLPRPILLKLARNKERIDGKYSVTQLISPTRIAYLREISAIYIKPEGAIKAFYGTAMHEMNSNEKSGLFAMEQTVSNDWVSGTIDLVDEGILWDYKVWGSYRVARALGMRSVKVPSPKTGKPINSYVPGGEPELDEETLQLNMYRILAKGKLPDVDLMKLFVIVKDAELRIAYSRGITRPWYDIIIQPMEDATVLNYFAEKADKLSLAITSGEIPPLCTVEERWGGNRCKYCDVVEFCNYGLEAKFIQEEDNGENSLS